MQIYYELPYRFYDTESGADALHKSYYIKDPWGKISQNFSIQSSEQNDSQQPWNNGPISGSLQGSFQDF